MISKIRKWALADAAALAAALSNKKVQDNPERSKDFLLKS